MQNREAPFSFARRAEASTSSTPSSFSGSTLLAWRALCGQYAQSSGQPPVFTESSVQSCTLSGAWWARWTVCARCTRSVSGRSWIARTSATVQSWRGSMGREA